jgi:hypothetical protein
MTEWADASNVALAAAGFALGLVHALDADHVMAVSALSSRRPGWRPALGHAARWGLGHGLSLGVLAGAVLWLGWALPEGWARTTEAVVGAAMIGLGAWVAWDVRRRGLHLHFHEHDGLPAHAHWHGHAPDETRADAHARAHARGHRHAPTLVGALHGAAGSAGVLGVVPAVSGGSLASGLVYLAAFGLGVLAAMAAFGAAFGWWLERARRTGAERGLRTAQLATAAGSMVVGGWWLAAAVGGVAG